MRQIKTANIKVDAFLMATAKEDSEQISKEDFVEQLKSFLTKDKKTDTKSDGSKEVTQDKSEEDFDVALNINLVNLNHLANQPVEIKTEASLLGEVVELPAEGITVDLEMLSIPTAKVLEINPDNLIKINKQEDPFDGNISIAVNDVSNPIDQTEVEEFLLKIETQLSENPEHEVIDVIARLFSENDLELDEGIKSSDLEDIESISQAELELILTRIEPNIRETKSLELNNNHEMNEMQNEGIEEEISIEQTKVTSDTEDSDLGLENEVDAQSVELSTIKTFEPVNRVDFAKEMNIPIQSVAQEDFISNIETLMIEETESTSVGDKVTTARIQLTPEHLGKVDLQIEINGKELTAKLIVEQKETKEWIDQQVAHLKEKLLTQEITVKDFQVVVHEENLTDAFMNSEENPFFKQKEKDSQARKEQRLLKKQVTDVPVQRDERSYSTRNGISILV